MALPSVERLALLEESAHALLRERLATSGYDSPFLADVESVAPRQLERLRLPLVQWWLERHPGPAADLALLFGYSGALPRERIEACLGSGLTAGLTAAGVLAVTADGSMRSEFLLIPLEGQWFLSDRLELGRDAVMGPGMTTLLLHRVLGEVPARSVLDLGCGAASLAIDAARRGSLAVAADLSARAVAVAAFNARLNGVAIETVVGDGMDAVRGRSFDLVLSQPPYLSLPEAGDPATYLHGGRRGDELALRFVSECARSLAPASLAALHFDSVGTAELPLAERLRGAIGDVPVDLLALVSRSASLDEQAILYSGVEHPGLDGAFERAARAHRAHLDALGAQEITQVLLLLRRPPAADPPSGRYRIVLETASVNRLRAGAIRDALAGLDLAARGADALLAARVAPSEGATFAGEWRSPADESPSRLKVVFGPGEIAKDRELGDRGWLLFGLLDGTRSVGETIAPYAEACESTADESHHEVLEFVREGLARCLLRVVSPQGSPALPELRPARTEG